MMGIIVLLLTAVHCLLGAALADQTSYPVSPHQSLAYPGQEVVPHSYPVQETEAYYQNYPSSSGGGGVAEEPYDLTSLSSGNTDRTLDVFTFPMVLTAFFSAMMGGLMAPFIVGVTKRMSEFELDLPAWDIEFPEVSTKKVKDKKHSNKNKGSSKSRALEDTIVSLVSHGFHNLLNYNRR